MSNKNINSPNTICEACNLSVSRDETAILHTINLTISRGAPFAIVGESGSGKTTLLLALTGLLTPQSGKIYFESQALESISFRERASIFGLVFQDYQLFPHLTIEENLLLAPQIHQLQGMKEKAMDLLYNMGIANLSSRYPDQISGGQKQRVAIARSLMLTPKIIFLDEPSAALDEKTTMELAALLLKLNTSTQIVAVSHDLPFLSKFAEQGMRLDEGRITATGKYSELF